MKTRKKLIEVALPLDAINKASAREKSIRHGHPSTLHLWWARRPLAAARAVIFAQMVDDPTEYVDVLRADTRLRKKAETALKARRKVWQEASELATRTAGSGLSVAEPGPEPTLDDVLADAERQRLFRIIEDLVLWENTTNEAVLQAARDEIWASWRRACVENVDHPRAAELFDRQTLPAFHDPFAGGGALPLEAQRLGLESYASDLNPVAVLINKAMIEIPPRFAGKPPVNPDARKDRDLFAREWKGPQGLATDVRHYGQWMRHEAEKRIGDLYPKVKVTAEMAKARPDLKPYVGHNLTVIAWLWARTVRSPNPAFANINVPLASTFMLSNKAGKEAYVEPVIETGGYRFSVKVGKPRDAVSAKNGTKLSRGANFQCLMSGVPIAAEYVRAEGVAGRMGARLLAIAAQAGRNRVYLSPTLEHEAAAHLAEPEWTPEGGFVEDARAFTPCIFGIKHWRDLFTSRQLTALTTFSDLLVEAHARARQDAISAGLQHDQAGFDGGGGGADAYADAVAVYLSFALDYAANYWSSLATPADGFIRGTFAMQALQMSWDFAEAPPFGVTSGNWLGGVEWVAKALEALPALHPQSAAAQEDAAQQSMSADKVVSTDPPYYDNVPYADLSDFFYVWLRRSQKQAFPRLFSTVAVPKAEELVAVTYRHESRVAAEAFFLDGMTHAMHRLSVQAHPAFPVTIYYAFKQSENDSSLGTASTGWETFLEAVSRAGFAVSGTWPMRTERSARNRSIDSNALASSIILVCRKRASDGLTASRREFASALKTELPQALAHLQRGNIAPVDLAQAAIGPGMAVYTRYAKVMDAEGRTLSVREALSLINKTLDDALAEQEGDFDPDTRWAITWFEQQGFDEGEYGVAEQLSKSKNTSVAGMVEAGILESKRGKVRLLAPAELPDDWDPATDPRLTAWEIAHHMIRVLENGGESAAAELLPRLGAKAEVARELAYRLYTVCERRKRAAEALSYNALVQSWPEIVRLARDNVRARGAEQAGLFAELEV
jgi:putative DNA methylase